MVLVKLEFFSMLNKAFISEEIVFLWQSDTFLCPSLKRKKNVVQQFTFPSM